MMKNFATITKSILMYVLTGTLYAYGMHPLLNHNQIECGKSNKKNGPALIFVSEGNYIFNEEQLHGITEDSSPVSIKSGETRTDKILFVSEETTLYNPQNVFIGTENKTHNHKVKVFAKKLHKKTLKPGKNEPATPINLYFTWNNGQIQFLLASDNKACICSITHNDHHKQLIDTNRFSLDSFVSSKDTLSKYNANMVSYYHIVIFSIRPPPLKNMFYNSG